MAIAIKTLVDTLSVHFVDVITDVLDKQYKDFADKAKVTTTANNRGGSLSVSFNKQKFSVFFVAEPTFAGTNNAVDTDAVIFLDTGKTDVFTLLQRQKGNYALAALLSARSASIANFKKHIKYIDGLNTAVADTFVEWMENAGAVQESQERDEPALSEFYYGE